MLFKKNPLYYEVVKANKRCADLQAEWLRFIGLHKELYYSPIHIATLIH